jgi:cytidyltransferase-like protein
MKNIVVVSGGFDPVHSGHIKLFKEARLLGDMLIVGINSDEWLARKKGRAFMPWNERLCVINNLAMVDEVYTFDDDDNTAGHLLSQVRAHYPLDKITFANGGDRTDNNIPEMSFQDNNIKFVFGIGGFNKSNSSSWILEEWKAPKTERPWGYYRVLHEVAGMKVKELTVNPGKSLSMQRHQHRSEYWIVSQGECLIDKESSTTIMRAHESIEIPKLSWHRLYNPYAQPVKVVEIQYGESCEELDIERRD